MEDCLFCKFANKELKTDIIYEDENVLGFKDIYPQAKEHYLFIPKKHYSNVAEMVEDNFDANLILKAMTKFAKESGLEETGYRIVNNLGADGGQTVFHVHFHLLGGQALKGFGA